MPARDAGDMNDCARAEDLMVQEEFLHFLKKHQVVYDEGYIWD